MEKKERKRKATIDDSPIKKQQRRSSHRFDLDGKQLRFYESGATEKYTESPQECEAVILCVLVSSESLAPIATLFPRVLALELEFCGDYQHDLNELKGCKTLLHLTIRNWGEENSILRLKNLRSLASLHLQSLVFFGQPLSPADPQFTWPDIRNPKWIHIQGISNLEKMLTYDLDISKLSNKAREKVKSLCGEGSSVENILVQQCQNSYQIIHHAFEGNHIDALVLISISSSMFHKIVGKDPPTSSDGLWMQDLDL